MSKRLTVWVLFTLLMAHFALAVFTDNGQKVQTLYDCGKLNTTHGVRQLLSACGANSTWVALALSPSTCVRWRTTCSYRLLRWNVSSNSWTPAIPCLSSRGIARTKRGVSTRSKSAKSRDA